jgi:protein HOOK3
VKLVNKDQLDIIASLRASVSEEKNSLAAEVEELKASIKAAEEKAKLQASQINKLLLDKIDLQSDSIAQRERMLQGEQTAACVPFLGVHCISCRNSSLRKDWSNPALKELNQKRLADLEQDLKTRSEEILVLQSKLDKARDFIKDQDALAKEKYTSLASVSSYFTRL